MKRIILLIVITVAGIQSKAQLMNPGFETWHTYTSGGVSLTAPNDWYGTDSIVTSYISILGTKQIYKSTDKNSGTYAARIITKTQGPLGIIPGIMMNARPGFNETDTTFSYSGGSAITEVVDSVAVWLKYVPADSLEGDTGQMQAVAVISEGAVDGTDSVIGTGNLLIHNTMTYTRMSMAIDYPDGGTPDKILIIFSSSPFSQSTFNSGLDGSILIVDDAELVMASGVHQVILSSQSVKVFPVPAQNVLNFSTSLTVLLQVEAYDITGHLVFSEPMQGNLAVNTTSLAAGNYSYIIKDGNRIIQQGKFGISK